MRHDAGYFREEPGAGKPHARICEGEAEWPSYSTTIAQSPGSAVKFGQPMRFEQLRAEAKVCAKPRLKQIYQQVADEIMAAVARLEPHEDKAQFP